MSSNLVTLKFNADALVRNWTNHHKEVCTGMLEIISHLLAPPLPSPLRGEGRGGGKCWVITKTSCTCTPSLDVLFGMIFIKKPPSSAEMKPAYQYGCEIFLIFN